MSLLMDKTLRDFSSLLASKEPAPGGGSTAALSGVLGTALSMMVVNLSVGKKAFEALDEDIKEKMLKDFEAVKNLNDELTELVDEDTRAFNSFMEAMKLPKDTESDKIKRSEEIQKASLYALKIPLAVAEKCLSILQHQSIIAQHGNRNAASDIGVGAVLALAGIEGAALNVRINIPGIDDPEIRADALARIESCLSHGKKLKEDIMEAVNARIG